MTNGKTFRINLQGKTILTST